MRFKCLRRFSLSFPLTLVLLFCLPVAPAQEEKIAEPAAIKQTSQQLDPLQGNYQDPNEPDTILTFSRQAGHFFVESARLPAIEIFAESPDRFFLKGSQTRYEFVRGENGIALMKLTIMGRRGLETTAMKKISNQPTHSHFPAYSRNEVMIPMRDGVKLHAALLRPKNSTNRSKETLPFLMQRTPYGVDGSTSDSINSQYTDLARSGYIFVMEDIRGRYGSEGKFQMITPTANHKDPKQTDQSTDTSDTVAWLLKNVPNNNGRVGVMGISYPGLLAEDAGIDPPAAIKAISPQAPMIDTWRGDDFFHNGAFRQTYGYDYAIGLESGKTNTFGKLDQDAYDYFLNAGSFMSAAQKSGAGDLPTWKDFAAHPAYDAFWQARSVLPYLNRVQIPTLEVGGWWDQEDMYGPQAAYAALKPHDEHHEVSMILGPWNHGQWSRTTRHLGALDFGSATGDRFRKLEAEFFAHHLKDDPHQQTNSVASFQTGSNVWKSYSEWPPSEGLKQESLYLEADGKLDFSPGSQSKQFVEYTSDPANPVPYRHRPIEATYAVGGSGWSTWLVEDQRFVADRKDVASWSTPALDHDITITGEVAADIFASTTGTDADWVVKLIDVYPADAPSIHPAEAPAPMSGYELMIADEIFRGRYRSSFEKPEPIKAGSIEEYKWSLHGADHVFFKGHKIMVQVQSSWFPLYDRNPQKFVENIMVAKPGDYQPATERIYGSAKYPSHLDLPIAEVPISIAR